MKNESCFSPNFRRQIKDLNLYYKETLFSNLFPEEIYTFLQQPESFSQKQIRECIMNEIRKDQNPKETIKQIKKILKTNNIKVKEYKVKNIYKDFYSIRLELKDFYNLGSNGKGLTKALAKASAYAELMERLESRMLINTHYLNKKNTFISYPDEKEDLNELNKNKQLLKSFFEKNIKISSFMKDNSKFSHVSKYKNLFTTKYEYLPSKLINATSFSNGLCAGNNYYEAISQGICEIFERYTYRQILLNEIYLPNLTIDDSLPINARINYLKSKGFNITIKDCTLGTYPVIGVYITNPENTKYIFTIGSDPNLNIAIQRCLTEAFQGLTTDEEILKKMKPINNNYDSLSSFDKKSNWLQNYSSNNGIHPKKIFSSNKTKAYQKTKIFSNLETNKQIYHYLLNIIKSNNLSIYIKDFSYLGFNSYKVFIPTLSNIEPINNNEKNIIKNFELLKEVYFNLENASSDKLTKASNLIEEILPNSKYSFIKLGNYFHANNYIKTFYNDITFELLYILINYKLNKKIDLNLLNNKKLIDYLISINSSDKYTYIINDLKLTLPTCPNCSTCKVRRTCKYKAWQKLNKTLKDKEKAFLK